MEAKDRFQVMHGRLMRHSRVACSWGKGQPVWMVDCWTDVNPPRHAPKESRK